MKNSQHPYHVSGIGLGPFNMSLAALVESIKTCSSLFLEQKPSFNWHENMLLDDSELQVSYLKDLVTLADPQNPYTFINYLSSNKRLYRFINAGFNYVKRAEFNQYMQWVSNQLSNVAFNQSVRDVNYNNKHFTIRTDDTEYQSQHLVLGTGLRPYVPEFARAHLGHTVFHNIEFLKHNPDWRGKRVAVIGGGQSGAEIVKQLLSSSKKLPSQLHWVSRRSLFLPMDDSPFINELFTPNYNQFFYQLEEKKKEMLIQQQALASDGISMRLLDEIYQRLYTLQCIENAPITINLMPDYQFQNMTGNKANYSLTVKNQSNHIFKEIDADIVILATGFRHYIPEFLNNLLTRIPLFNDYFQVNQDYSVRWHAEDTNKIYVQNGARHSHGVADPNLSLMAWRSATICNSLLGYKHFDIENEDSSLQWQQLVTPDMEENKDVAA